MGMHSIDAIAVKMTGNSARALRRAVGHCTSWAQGSPTQQLQVVGGRWHGACCQRIAYLAQQLQVVGGRWHGACCQRIAYLAEKKIPFLYMKVGSVEEDGLNMVLQWMKKHGMDVSGDRAGPPFLFSNAEGAGLRLARGHPNPDIWFLSSRNIAKAVGLKTDWNQKCDLLKEVS